MKKVFSPLNLLLALVLTLFVICTAVVVTLNFRPLYYLDVELAGYPRALPACRGRRFLQNYNVLIDYNSSFRAEDARISNARHELKPDASILKRSKMYLLFLKSGCSFPAYSSAAGIIFRHFRKNPGYLLLTAVSDCGASGCARYSHCAELAERVRPVSQDRL